MQLQIAAAAANTTSCIYLPKRFRLLPNYFVGCMYIRLKEMTWKLEKKSFRWKHMESLEAPRVVHVRTTEMLTKDNVYAQVTVRLLTRQVTYCRLSVASGPSRHF